MFSPVFEESSPRGVLNGSITVLRSIYPWPKSRAVRHPRIGMTRSLECIKIHKLRTASQDSRCGIASGPHNLAKGEKGNLLCAVAGSTESFVIKDLILITRA